MIKTNVKTLLMPEEIDAELSAVLYRDRCSELLRFFFRRTRNPETSAALLAQTFATAAQIRLKKKDEKSADDQDWLTSIATLELIHYFRSGVVSDKAVRTLGMTIPPLSGAELEQLEADMGPANVVQPKRSEPEVVVLD